MAGLGAGIGVGYLIFGLRQALLDILFFFFMVAKELVLNVLFPLSWVLNIF